MKEPESQRNAVMRTGLLAYRKKHGNEKWLELYKKMGGKKVIKPN